MPDESTATAGAVPSTEPSGAEADTATFDKFFGKDSKLWDEKGKPKEAKADKGGKDSSKDTGAGSKKEESSPASKKADTSKASEKDTSGKDKKSESPTKKSTDDSDSSKASSEKSSAKDSKAKADPEDDADDPKALYDRAKKATDTREGRKLYKQAMQKAFGEIPEEFNDAKWKAAREKRDADRAEIAEGKKRNEERIQGAVQKLTPAINVMKRLQAAGFVAIDPKTGAATNHIQESAVNQSIEVMKALRELEHGDFTALGRLVEKASGKSQEEAMKLYVRGVKTSPEGSAARRAAEEARQQAERAQAELAELRRQLAERDEGQTRAQRQRETEQKRANYLQGLKADLVDHPVLKLPRGAERVMNYIVKTADKVLKSPRYTPEQAADRIVAYERKRLADSRAVLDTEGQPAPENATRERVRALPRGESVESGTTPDTPEASFDRIWSRHRAGGRR